MAREVRQVEGAVLVKVATDFATVYLFNRVHKQPKTNISR
jgi:hypothetical protein